MGRLSQLKNVTELQIVQYHREGLCFGGNREQGEGREESQQWAQAD